MAESNLMPLDVIADGERLHAEWLAAIDAEDHQRIISSYSRAAFWLLTRAPALFVVTRAAEKRLRYGHNDTCSAVLGIEPPYNVCSCGHDEQAAALDRLTPENPDA